ncbi:MAG: hypothetical protein R8J84_08660 [Mariprofundales bacterium]
MIWNLKQRMTWLPAYAAALALLLSFGGGYAYSALSMTQQSAIRIAYANGYKDAVDFASGLKQEEVRKMTKDFGAFKAQVMMAADHYIAKVEAMNQ